jgi:copper chaperone CopZ
MKTVDIAIEGMHCGGCVKRVEEAIRKLPGAAAEKVEIGRARVKVDGAEPEMVVAALERLGFDARVTQEG